MATIFSGIQPTGEVHLGNYMGALRHWVELSKKPEHTSYFSIVDCHAFTIPYDAATFPRAVFDAAVAVLAVGLDERATVFVQSDVPQHTELAWYLGCVAPMGELGRMTQFKEKSEQHKTSVGAGLFTYPILMAADILLYKGTLVPVGHDQLQHLEFARDMARHFNHRFKAEVFPEPKPHHLTLRIKGTDGGEKMSKSRGNTIAMLDTPEQVWKKLKGAFTDPQRLTREIPGRPEVCNIYTMHTVVTPEPALTEVVHNGCTTAKIGCGDCKKLLAESLERDLGPVRARANELRAQPGRVLEILNEGGATCRAKATETMREVKEAAGVFGARSRP
ncbi:MAG: tryptophan--tRNA ligase [Polyangiaceae bacterium]|nr:tryptophan--tRNA ligase [Polyangiaceae bacterium]